MAVSDWTALIEEASRATGVPANVISAVMAQESGGKTTLNGQPTTSHAGAQGLMQVMPGTWRELQAQHPEIGDDPHDPRGNILAGAYYLADMYRRYGRWDHALGAYNAGPGRMDQYLREGRALPGETTNYISSVFPRISGEAGAATPNPPQGGAPVPGPTSPNPFGNRTPNTATRFTRDVWEDRRREADEQYTLGWMVEDAWEQNTLNTLWRSSQFMAPDPDFRWRDNKDLWTELSNGVPTADLDGLANVQSAAAARRWRENFDREVAYATRLGRQGVLGGFTIGLLQGVFDPVNWVVPTGAGFVASATTKTGRALRTMLAGSAANVGFEAAVSPFRSTGSQFEDYLFAGLLGAAFGPWGAKGPEAARAQGAAIRALRDRQPPPEVTTRDAFLQLLDQDGEFTRWAGAGGQGGRAGFRREVEGLLEAFDRLDPTERNQAGFARYFDEMDLFDPAKRGRAAELLERYYDEYRPTPATGKPAPKVADPAPVVDPGEGGAVPVDPDIETYWKKANDTVDGDGRSLARVIEEAFGRVGDASMRGIARVLEGRIREALGDPEAPDAAVLKFLGVARDKLKIPNPDEDPGAYARWWIDWNKANAPVAPPKPATPPTPEPPKAPKAPKKVKKPKGSNKVLSWEEAKDLQVEVPELGETKTVARWLFDWAMLEAVTLRDWAARDTSLEPADRRASPITAREYNEAISKMRAILSALPELELQNVYRTADEALATLEPTLHRFTPEEGEIIRQFIRGLNGKGKRRVFPHFTKPSENPENRAFVSFNLADGATGNRVTLPKDRWPGPQSFIEVALHEVAHWGYLNILTPAERLAFMERVGKRYFKADGTLNVKKLEGDLPYHQGLGKDFQWPNTMRLPQELFANQFVLWAVRNKPELNARSLFQKVAWFVQKVFDNWFSKTRQPAEFAAFFQKIYGDISAVPLRGTRRTVPAPKRPAKIVAASETFEPPGDDPLVLYSSPNIDNAIDWQERISEMRTRGKSLKSALNEGWMRFDAIGQLKRSLNPAFRYLGSVLGEDAVGNVDYGVLGGTATEFQNMTHRVAVTNMSRVYMAAYREWADARGMSWKDRNFAITLKREFGGQVAAVVRNMGDLTQIQQTLGDDFKFAKKAADGVVAMNREYLKLAKRYGVKGFDNVDPNDAYLYRMIDPVGLSKLVHRFGNDTVINLVAGAIKAADPTRSDKLTLSVARAYVRHARGINDTRSQEVARALDMNDIQAIKDLLLAEGGDLGFTMKDLDELLDGLGKPPGDGKMARAKRRTLLDENFVMEVPTAGGGVERLAVSDLFNNDAFQVSEIYSRQMSGMIALAKVGFKSKNEFRTMLAKLETDARENLAGTGYTQRALTRDLENVEYLYMMITGSPIRGRDLRRTEWARGLRIIRDFNFARFMNQAGAAQLAEVGNLLCHVGLKHIIKGVPSLRGLMRRGRDGKLHDDLAHELESIWGIGGEDILGYHSSHIDEFGTVLDEGEGKWMAKAEGGMRMAANVTSVISGMRLVTTALHRMALAGLTQKFTDIAYGLTKVGEGRRNTLERFASAGISEEMLNRIQEQIVRHSTLADGDISKAKLRRINLEKWDDVDAAEAFRMGVFRMARRVVQENDPGMMHRWFSHPVAQIFLQFRSFMLGAWTKQLLHGIHHRDFEAWTGFMMSILAGGLAYVAQTSLNSLGQADAQKYREDRLSLGAISAAAFQRAAFASLIPMFVDQGAYALGLGPMFDYRTTGLASQGLTSNPTFQIYDSLTDMIGGASAPFRSDYSFSQNNLRSLGTLLPWGNAMGMRQMFNVLGSDLPAKSVDPYID